MTDDQVPVVPDLPLLRSALSLAERGWHVFPCVPGGKRPALRGSWQDHASTEPARIRAWWSRAAYNIGIACGPSGLVVIDLDVPHDIEGVSSAEGRTTGSGADVLADLCGQNGQPYPMPTYAIGTPSGGCHLYYAAPRLQVRNSAGRLGPHIDIRAYGGYVIGDGSRIRGRPYTTRDQRWPVPLPEWLAGLLEDGPSFPSAPPSVPVRHRTGYAMAALYQETLLVATAQLGTRNHALNRAAFSLGQLVAAEMLSAPAVVTALADAAERAGLPIEEARRTIRSGMTAGARNPRAQRRVTVQDIQR
jgi:hypothetical protein